MIRLLFLLPLIALLVIFALSNRAPAQVQFWPFDLSWEAPLALIVLFASALSFLLGAVVAWGAALPARRRARALEKAGRLLETELDRLKAEVAARREGGFLSPREGAMPSRHAGALASPREGAAS